MEAAIKKMHTMNDALLSQKESNSLPPVPTPLFTAMGTKWSTEEDSRLIAELDTSATIAKIAKDHDRTEGGITSRIREIACRLSQEGCSDADITSKTKLTAQQIADAVDKKLKSLQGRSEKRAATEKKRTDAVPRPVIDTAQRQRLSVEQTCALQQFEDDDNLFITGEGGTGKTCLIKHLVASAKRQSKKVQVCALTGCAALLLECNARTIHSWSGIKLGRGDVDDIVSNVFQNHKARSAWRSTDILIVDEISMMSKRIFEVLDIVGRRVRGSGRPFGGLQVVFVGDFFQLPPVATSADGGDDSKFCFESDQWFKTFPMDNHIELTTMFRQSNDTFRGILGNIRKGLVVDADVSTLQQYVDRPFDADKYQGIVPTKLFPTKNKVEAINREMFEKLAGDCHTFEFVSKTDCTTMMDGGGKDIPRQDLVRCKKLLTPQKRGFELDSLANNSPCVKSLHLKMGANVMCTANLDLDGGICNGSIGTVVGFTGEKGMPVVRFSNGVKRVIDLKFWQSEEFPTVAVGQIPLCLAWAVTIHKIQGATLSMAEIDIGSGIFECGQTYVALSRVKDLDGLYLSKFDPKKIKTNVRVGKFYRDIPRVEYEVEEEVEEELEMEEEMVSLSSHPLPVSDGACGVTFDRFAATASTSHV